MSKILPPYFPATLADVITGPGRYVTRSGETVTVYASNRGPARNWHGSYPNGVRERWHSSGRLFPTVDSRNDIVRAAEPAIVAPLSRICPNQHFCLLDDGMGELARVPAAAWAAAHYHATTGVSS